MWLFTVNYGGVTAAKSLFLLWKRCDNTVETMPFESYEQGLVQNLYVQTIQKSMVSEALIKYSTKRFKQLNYFSQTIELFGSNN